MKSIQINGYKSIKKLDLVLNPINILIGANGSGKSNFLSFFEFLKNIYNSNLKEFVALRGGVNKFLHRGDKVTDEISCKLFFKGTNAYSFTLKKGEDAFIFTKEGLWYGRNPYWDNPVEIASFDTEARVRFAGVTRAAYIRKYLNSLEKYHFHDTGVFLLLLIKNPILKTINISYTIKGKISRLIYLLYIIATLLLII